MAPIRAYRAGESLEDHCRPARPIAFTLSWPPMRRAGRSASSAATAGASTTIAADHGLTCQISEDRPHAAPHQLEGRRAQTAREPFPIVSDRERIASPMSSDSMPDLELLLRRVIREEAGISPVPPAEKWRGGTLVLRPGTPGSQEKSWPIETFFHKVVMLRNRLRTLEQHVNASELPNDLKVKLQGYITGCYGSLTSFNVLFADEDDQFKGSSGE